MLLSPLSVGDALRGCCSFAFQVGAHGRLPLKPTSSIDVEMLSRSVDLLELKFWRYRGGKGEPRAIQAI